MNYLNHLIDLMIKIILMYINIFNWFICYMFMMKLGLHNWFRG